jgi:ectoine hydroxylase-related dioxygenase (phytanoyl-CoA dioxygenase family)
VDAHNGTLHLVPGSHKILPHIESIEATVRAISFSRKAEDARVLG